MAVAVPGAPAHSAELLAWYASLGQPAEVLKSIADRGDLDDETRAGALKQLARTEATQLDYVETRLRELALRSGRASVAHEYGSFVRKRSGPERASRVLREWLERNADKQDLGWIHVATELSKSLQAEGKLEASLTLIRPLAGSGKEEAVAQAAAVLQELGRHAEAREMAEENLARYPSSGLAVAALAEILWKQHSDADAADLLQRNDKFLTRSDWHWLVAAAFANAFAKAPVEAAGQAFDRLPAHGLVGERLSGMVRATAAKGRHDVALAISERTAPVAKQAIYDWLATYREMKEVMGAPAATEWLKSRLTVPSVAETASTAFYFDGEHELLWSALTSLPNREKNNMLQLFRALALVRMRTEKQDPRWPMLTEHFEKADGRDVLVGYGRYVVGLDSEQTLIASLKSPKGICDLSYLIGVRKVNERKYDDAMDWFQAALETGNTATPLYNGTERLLTNWTRTEESFGRIAAEGK